jgi:hypothetical protein
LTVDSQGGTFLADWVINLTQFTFNERIDPNSWLSRHDRWLWSLEKPFAFSPTR